MKGEGGASSNPTSPSPRASTSRPSFGQRGQTPQAITDGRRLYVGNMPYTAKAEDVEALFTAAEFSMYVCAGSMIMIIAPPLRTGLNVADQC